MDTVEKAQWQQHHNHRVHTGKIFDVLAGIDLMERHNLNSADAGILATFLRYSQSSADTCLLVAADQRLLRAATAEGLATLNPEILSAADVSAFLTAL